MMKKVIIVFILLAGWSCQQEEFTVIDTQDEESFLVDQQLTGLIQSVSSHDGSYDDVVDASPCFSINFPYEVVFKGQRYQIASIKDLAIFEEGDEVSPVFPIVITSASYEPSRIRSMEQFVTYIDRCANGLMYNEGITCVDFVYPVEVSVYDPATSNFELMTLEHDKQTFLTLEDMNRELIARIRYPLELNMTNGTRLEISDDDDLKSSLLEMLTICE